ncbi:MAG: hypothetical protein OXD40_02040 [bacterium]|nr:hypothetical protein [bacterium]
MSDDAKTAAEDPKARKTWRCPPGLWRRWKEGLPPGSDAVRQMTGRVAAMVRNVERQKERETRTVSYALPAAMADAVAVAAEARGMSPSEWAAEALAMALAHCEGVEPVSDRGGLDDGARRT